MSDIAQQIQNLTDNFTAAVANLAKQAAIDAMQAALGGAAAPTAPRKPVKTSNAARTPGEKRAPEELAKVQSKVLAYIANNAGTRIEPMGKALNLKTSEMALPIKKLLASGEVRSEGERRATKYFAGDIKVTVSKPKAAPKKKAAPKSKS